MGSSSPTLPPKKAVFFIILQESLPQEFHFGTLTVDGYKLLTYFAVWHSETALMRLLFTIYSVFLMHVETADRGIGFEKLAF
ncbi:hypothetical protein NYA22BAC_03246 [Parasphingorhabdus sp. NYA22]